MPYYPVHRLIAWQPQGTLDDLMLDQIADWLGDTEKVFPPFKRFVDFSQLTSIAVRTRHVFEFARKRAEQFTGVEPVQTALFADDWVCHAIARLYESLMEDTLIEARAFKDLARAAEWLGIPVDVLTLKESPWLRIVNAHNRNRAKYWEIIADNLRKAGKQRLLDTES